MPVVEMLGLDLSAAPAIARCRVVGRHRTYEFEFPRPARGVSRLFLDDALHRRAVAAGARPITAQANSVARDRVDDIRARVVVGAWGRWGRFDQQLGRAFVRDRAHRHFGFKRHYSERRAAGGEQVIELYSFGAGYLGVSPIEGGLTNICGLVHASRLSGLKGRWDAFVDTIRAEEPRLEELYARHEPAQDGFLSSEPVIFRGRSPVVGGIFMIGDASGIVDPLTGNGMAMAMQSALVAAPYVVRALDAPDEAAREYTARHAKFFAPRIAWSRRVAFLLSRPGLLDAAMRLRSRAAGPFFLRHTRAEPDDVRILADAWTASRPNSTTS